MPEMRENQQVQQTRSFFDYTLIFVILFLCAFGLVMLYSTTAYKGAISASGNTFYLAGKQGKFMAFSFVWMLIVSFIDYHWYRKFLPFLYVLTFVLAIGVFFIGKSSHGSARWYQLGPINFQPAELVKITVILCMAAYTNALGTRMNDIKALLLMAVLVIIIGLPTLKENLSSGIIIMMIGFTMAFVATRLKAIFAILMGGGVIAVVGAYKIGLLAKILDEYQMNRIYAWLDPHAYSSSLGYQILQGLYAIGSGGFFGRGLGQSIQKLGALPEAQNDMIFSVICEELGIFGASLVIILFAVLLWRVAMIALNAPDMMGAMIAVGVFVHFALQVIFNIAVNTNVIPNTGITLPFISYGGTSVLFLMTEIGLVLNVSRQIRVKV